MTTNSNNGGQNSECPKSVTCGEELETLIRWLIEWANSNEYHPASHALKQGYRNLLGEYQREEMSFKHSERPSLLEINTPVDLHDLLGRLADKYNLDSDSPPTRNVMREAQEFILLDMLGREPDSKQSREIVINKSHGGFGLSNKALRTLHGEFGWEIGSEEKINKSKTEEDALTLNPGRRSDRDLRTDEDLIHVVERLGEEASARHCELKVVEIPANVHWELESYDGKEWIAEAHRTWS